MIEIGVFGTIAAATLAWAVAECCRLLGRGLALARGLWTAGAALLVIHSTIAFAVFYRGSHAVALAETARQTKALTGIDSGLGLYVNIAFATIWIADAAAWWRRPAATAGIGPGQWLRLAFFVFMFVNGAVIFADGWMRVLGAAATLMVVAAAGRRIQANSSRDLIE